MLREQKYILGRVEGESKEVRVVLKEVTFCRDFVDEWDLAKWAKEEGRNDANNEVWRRKRRMLLWVNKVARRFGPFIRAAVLLWQELKGRNRDAKQFSVFPQEGAGGGECSLGFTRWQLVSNVYRGSLRHCIRANIDNVRRIDCKA